MEPLYIAGGNVKWCSHFGKQLVKSSEGLNIELSFDTAILCLPRYTPKRNKNIFPYKNVYTNYYSSINHYSPKVERPKYISTAAAAVTTAAKSLQLCLTLCDPIDSSPSGSSVPGILQARILEWVAISFSNACMHAKSLQSCLTLRDPMDSSPPGSSIHGIV